MPTPEEYLRAAKAAVGSYGDTYEQGAHRRAATAAAARTAKDSTLLGQDLKQAPLPQPLPAVQEAREATARDAAKEASASTAKDSTLLGQDLKHAPQYDAKWSGRRDNAPTDIGWDRIVGPAPSSGNTPAVRRSVKSLREK